MCFRPPTLENQKVKCPKCGTEVDASADICPNCGAKAAPAVQPVKSPSAPPTVPSVSGVPAPLNVPKMPATPKPPDAG